jgi:transcriptional regulator with XRE-family HTH domain
MPRARAKDLDTTLPSIPGDPNGAAELNQRVAVNLREHRRMRDLSLDELARQTGVSRAGLSQIETCKTNPSLGVLWKIAAGLGIPFASLIGEASPPVSVLRRKASQPLRSSDRKFESRPVLPSTPAKQIEMYELRLSPRARHLSEAHGAGTRELVVVTAGTLRMTSGERVEDLEEGDAMLFNANVAHIYENPGSTEARCHNLIMYTLR